MTGWLARLQLISYPSTKDLSLLTTLGDITVSDSLVKRSAVVARRYPNDFEVQLANAMNAESTDQVVSRLEYLKTRYPHNPVLIAALLRQMNSGQVLVRREEVKLLQAPEDRTSNASTSQQSRPERIAMYLALAAEGEKLESNNAFFTIANAIGNFAAKDDVEGIAAWKRASEKTEWNDYLFEEVTAKWKLQQAMNNGREIGSLPRMMTMGSILLPHYAQIRAAARMATVKAVEAELAGEKETGFALRVATRKNGATIVKHGQLYITSLIGTGIAETVASRPGGVEAEKEQNSETKAGIRQEAEKRERYVTYLRSVGHPDEANAFMALITQRKALQEVWDKGKEDSSFSFGKKTFQLLGGWLVNALLLTSALFSLVFAVIFKLVYRYSPRLQQGEPLQSSARWGIIGGLALPVLIAATLLASNTNASATRTTVFLVGSGIYLLTLGLLGVFLKLSGRRLLHGIVVILATGGALLGMFVAGAVIWHLFSGTVQVVSVLQGCMSASETAPVDPMPFWMLTWLVPAVPFGMLCLFGIFSRILKVPLAAGVTRGMRAMAIPLSATLMIVWGGTLLYTLNQEDRTIAEMQRIAAIGELQTLAELSHQQYPN